MNIFEELQWRGLLADCTDTPELTKRLAAGPVTLYCGFDPTADSLHVGHLVPLLALRRFQNAGHCPIAVAGGATGSIGDPSGKSAERQLLTKDQIKANVEAVRPQLARLLDFDRQPNAARLVDNADWTAQVTYLDFLRDFGKHFTVNQMVAKESVRARMEDREVGISYTEFSYMLLQSFDFFHLCQDFGCELQIGGSDQWGNITAGIDLIRKKLGRYAFGLTLPLITKADGTKFGKTEGGAVWLDPKKTLVDSFYNFWINTDDRDVIRYLKFFTFLNREEIASLEEVHKTNPGAREAHRALAEAVTTLVHGHEAMRAVQKTNDGIYSQKLLNDLVNQELLGINPERSGRELMEQPTDLIIEELRQDNACAEEATTAAPEPLLGINPRQSLKELMEQPSDSVIDELRRNTENQATASRRKHFEDLSKHLPQASVEKSKLEDAGILLVELLVQSGLCPSKGQARKDIEGGGIYVNNVREASVARVVMASDLLFGRHLLLRKGKKNYVVMTAR